MVKGGKAVLACATSRILKEVRNQRKTFPWRTITLKARSAMEKERRLHHLVTRGVILLSGPASATLVLTSWFHFECCKCAQLCSRFKHHFLSKWVYSLLIRVYWSFCKIAYFFAINTEWNWSTILDKTLDKNCIVEVRVFPSPHPLEAVLLCLQKKLRRL